MEENAPKSQEESQKEKNPSAGSGQAKTPPRKAVVILGIVFIVLLIIIAIVGRGAPQRPEPKPTSQSPDTQIGDLEKTYESPLFTFQYPTAWKPQLYNILGGGNGITIRPANVTATDYYPRLHIEASPVTAEGSMEKRLDLLSRLRLERTNTTFQSYDAVKLSGRLPFLDKDKKPLNPPIRKTYLFFENAGFLYIISYAYFEDDKAEEKEQFFSNILDTVTLPEGAL